MRISEEVFDDQQSEFAISAGDGWSQRADSRERVSGGIEAYAGA